MSGVPIRARKASKHVKREEGGVKLQQDRRTGGRREHISLAPAGRALRPFIRPCPACLHQQDLPPLRRMATLYLSLALVLFLSRPAPAQWWNFFRVYPRTSTLPPSITSPPVAQEPTEWFSEEDKSVEGHTRSPGGSGSVRAGTSTLEQPAAGRSQNKPLKHWRSGEYPRTSR